MKEVSDFTSHYGYKEVKTKDDHKTNSTWITKIYLIVVIARVFRKFLKKTLRFLFIHMTCIRRAKLNPLSSFTKIQF